MSSMDLVLHRAPPSLSAQGLVPPAVWNALRRALAKPPSQRYPHARALLDTLDAAARPVRVLRVGPGMSHEQARAALYDPSQHAWVAPSPDRRTIPPPPDARTAPPPPVPSSRASLPPPARFSVPPAANDADALDEPFTGNPSDYWWSVQVQGAHTADDILGLLELPELARVVELHVAGAPLGDAGVARLTAGAHLHDLAVLSLRRTEVTPRGAAAIAGAASLSNLLKLDLEQNPLGTDGLRTVLAGRHLGNLRALSMVLTDLDDEAAEALADSSKLPHLVRLDLSQNRLGDDGALCLAQHPRLSPDLWLSLSRNHVSASAAELAQRLLASRIRKVVL